MQAGDRWHLFEANYFMSLTMAVGSFIAGATSEGGGAVAFPVMTLGFKIAPDVARDFSLLIQT
ncbi:MAG: putative membrane protein YfcA, partial [Planctomycetota bacterium]